MPNKMFSVGFRRASISLARHCGRGGVRNGSSIMDFRGNRCRTMPAFFSYVLKRKDAGTDLYFLGISCDLARGHRRASPVLRE